MRDAVLPSVLSQALPATQTRAPARRSSRWNEQLALRSAKAVLEPLPSVPVEARRWGALPTRLPEHFPASSDAAGIRPGARQQERPTVPEACAQERSPLLPRVPALQQSRASHWVLVSAREAQGPASATYRAARQRDQHSRAAEQRAQLLPRQDG